MGIRYPIILLLYYDFRVFGEEQRYKHRWGCAYHQSELL
jgi:hypothetical protein